VVLSPAALEVCIGRVAGAGEMGEPPLSASTERAALAVLVGETTGGGFQTLGGDKTHCFITNTKSLQTQKAYNTRPLFLFSLSSVSL
jgi:hypothetical protein